MKPVILLMACLWGAVAAAQDVVIIGEVHDNPHHHALQTETIAELQPAALVFEMLTTVQASAITGDALKSSDVLADILGWEKSGWPDFEMYYPLFTAAPGVRFFGAGVSREDARAVISGGETQDFDAISREYGLEQPLPPDQQSAREALQMSAHCDALPEEMLPAMVQIQRLRDAVLANAVRQAVAETGGPVAVITGNGHARRDWGIPALLAEVAPDLTVVVIGQTEDDHPLEGEFDQVVSAPSVERPDPCKAFQ